MVPCYRVSSHPLQLIPNIADEHISVLFQRGLGAGHRKFIASLDGVFSHVFSREYERYFWQNNWTRETQWKKPFEPETFIVDDLELDTFVALCLDEVVLAASPYIPLLDKDPQELWENPATYLEEYEAEATEKRAAAARRAEESMKQDIEDTTSEFVGRNKLVESRLRGRSSRRDLVTVDVGMGVSPAR